MKPDCIFCKIAKKELPSEGVYEDETSFAFLDNAPANIGHTLLIPKEHFENLYELPEEVLLKMAPVIKKLALAVKNATGADGINIGMNNGSAAGQEVFHAHIHIIPRFEDDGLQPWGVHRKYKEGEAKEVSEKITEALKSE